MEVYKSFDPIHRVDIDKFEITTGIILPDEYVKFLLTHNGGYIRPYAFYFDDEGIQELGLVNFFFGLISEESWYSLYENYQQSRQKLPERMLPIADTGVGNLICISLSGIDCGNIFYMLHEIIPENEDNIRYVASSLTEFRDSLFEYIEDDE